MVGDIKLDELLNLIALKMGGKYSLDTVNKFLVATEKVILDELKLNGRIKFRNFGVFEIYEFGGYDMKTGNFIAGEGSSIRYINPKTKVRFSPSSVFENAINNNFEIPKKKRKGNKSIEVDPNKKRYIKKPKPSMGECMADLLSK